MNKLTALISTLVIGMSSAAMASPAAFSAHASASFNWAVATRPLVRPVVKFRARPIVVRPVSTSNVRDHRWDSSYDDYSNAGYTTPTRYSDGGYRQPYQPVRNATLASGITFSGSRGELQLDVGNTSGCIEGIRIAVLNQGMILSYVMVRYTNGQEEMINMTNNQIHAGETLDIRFNTQGRSVARIDMFRNASTELVGWGSGQFDVTTL